MVFRSYGGKYKDTPRLQSAKIVLTNRISLKSVEENKFVPTKAFSVKNGASQMVPDRKLAGLAQNVKN